MKQPEYMEGTEALENFKRGMIALFKVPKKAIGGWPTQACFWLEWGCSYVTDTARWTS
jgi:hypothetical protein